jgi:hypothetical protein
MSLSATREVVVLLTYHLVTRNDQRLPMPEYVVLIFSTLVGDALVKRDSETLGVGRYLSISAISVTGG